MLLDPRFDQGAVAIAFKSQWCQHLSLAPGGGHRDALGAVSQAFTKTPLAFFAPAVGIAQSVVHAGFIQINPVTDFDLFEFDQKGLPAFFAALAVAPTLFLRVQPLPLTPMRLKAIENGISVNLTPVSVSHATDICSKVQPL